MPKRIEILVGAAVGLGMTARAAADGGADFLLALSAGRLRVMGAPSLAAMLPIRDSNAFTDEFARGEILDRVAIPIFFGAAACDPRLSLDAMLGRIRDTGYDGVANFPSAIHQHGAFRAALEQAGLGFAREIEMIRAAPCFGLATLGYAKTRAEARGAPWSIERVYATFPRLAERRRNGGAELSGGEQQMLAIARALLMNPKLVIMDEPSEGLAPVIVDQLIELLRGLPADGMGVLLVEQNLRVATEVAQEVAIMVTGRIATTMPARQLAEDLDLQRRYLGVAAGGH